MLIPLGTNRPLKRKSRITPVIIALNIIIYTTQIILQSSNPDLAKQLLNFGHVWKHDLTLWSPITSAFLHGSFLHLAGNMLGLLVFGPPVEDRFGRIGFTIFYLLGAIGSGLFHTLISDHPAIGASGAIAAVTGSFLIFFPNCKVRILWFLILIQFLLAPAWWIISLWIILDLFSGVFDPGNGVANGAHLAGYTIGAATALILLATKVLQREPAYDLFSIIKHKQRKRAFKAAAHHATPRPSRQSPLTKQQAQHAAELAARRANIAQRVTENNLDDATDRYLAMLDYFKDDPNAATTLHRDAQYAIATHLYQTNRKPQALDAYQALLKAYPTDKERDVICILRARIQSQDLNNPDEALEILKHLIAHTTDQDTIALAQSELDAIRNTQQ